MTTLLRLSPWHLPRIWPRVADLVRRGLGKNPSMNPEDVLAQLREGRMVMWLVTRSAEIVAAMVTQVVIYPRKRVLCLFLVAGRDREAWLPYMPRIEEYAREQNCNNMELFGREGWARVLPDWTRTRIVLEKEL